MDGSGGDRVRFSFRRPQRTGTEDRRPDDQPKAPAIGIDLGTTFTVVSHIEGGEARIIQNDDGNELTPSVVTIEEEILLVGEEAVKKRRDPSSNTIYNIKRIMGRHHNDLFLQERKWPFEIVRGRNDRASVRIDEELYTPEWISAVILCYMKKVSTKKFCGIVPTDAVITVPANFTNAQRQATKDAGKLAGLNVLQIVNEPTAAAIAFSEESKSNPTMQRVLVFDLGGGTFDVSIVEIEGLQTTVIATEGLTTLGGSDFDERIYAEAVTRYKKKDIKITDVDWTLMELCEKAKKALSRIERARISHPRHNGEGFELTRAEFNGLCVDLFEQTIDVTERVLSDAGLTVDKIDEVLLVGGSTRIPRIRQMLCEMFPKEKIRDDIEPELAVAKGAAILADALACKSCETEPIDDENSSSEEGSDPDLLFDDLSALAVEGPTDTLCLQELAPLQLSLRIDADRCAPLVPKHTLIPFSTYRFCTNAADNVTKLEIAILEGTNTQASHNLMLTNVAIDISPKPAGKTLIKVNISIDINGIIAVSAVDMHTSREVTATISREEQDAFAFARFIQQLR